MVQTFNYCHLVLKCQIWILLDNIGQSLQTWNVSDVRQCYHYGQIKDSKMKLSILTQVFQINFG